MLIVTHESSGSIFHIYELIVKIYKTLQIFKADNFVLFCNFCNSFLCLIYRFLQLILWQHIGTNFSRLNVKKSASKKCTHFVYHEEKRLICETFFVLYNNTLFIIDSLHTTSIQNSDSVLKTEDNSKKVKLVF